MTDHRDVIAAFVDNEPVGAGELSDALASADGREYLIDVLVLRGLVSDVRPGVGRAQGHSVDGATGLQSRGRTGRWLTLAAALVVASLTAGYFAGRGSTNESAGTAGTATQAVEPAGSSARPAPAPTHVIRMEKGVDWNERSGGN